MHESRTRFLHVEQKETRAKKEGECSPVVDERPGDEPAGMGSFIGNTTDHPFCSRQNSNLQVTGCEMIFE